MPRFIKITIIGDDDGEIYKESYQSLVNVNEIDTVYGSNSS